MNLEALVAPLRADVVSGAAALGGRAAELVVRVARRAEAEGPGELRRLLASLSLRILDAQPAMAPLVALGADVLLALEEGLSLEESRERAVEAALRFREGLELAGRAVAEQAEGLLPDGACVLTLSASSTVRATLLRAASQRRLSAICLESRPMSEGQRMATHLAGAGIRVVYAVDAAVGSLVSRASVVLLGADSVGDLGVVNKIGSRPAVREAEAQGIPVHVLADRTKLLPPGFPQPTDDDRPDDEVWRGPQGVRVWNRYFETFSLASVRGVVTERGRLDPAETARVRADLHVPEELRAWAERKRAEATIEG